MSTESLPYPDEQPTEVTSAPGMYDEPDYGIGLYVEGAI